MHAFEQIVLPKDKLDYIAKYESSFGKDWAANVTIWSKADEYIRANLVRVQSESSRKKCGRCCEEGKDVYRRIDKQPIAQDDLFAFAHWSRGQVNKIHGKPGDLQLMQEWVCDSGD
jgi:hypothetical protein